MLFLDAAVPCVDRARGRAGQSYEHPIECGSRTTGSKQIAAFGVRISEMLYAKEVMRASEEADKDTARAAHTEGVRRSEAGAVEKRKQQG